MTDPDLDPRWAAALRTAARPDPAPDLDRAWAEITARAADGPRAHAATGTLGPGHRPGRPSPWPARVAAAVVLLAVAAATLVVVDRRSDDGVRTQRTPPDSTAPDRAPDPRPGGAIDPDDPAAAFVADAPVDWTITVEGEQFCFVQGGQRGCTEPQSAAEPEPGYGLLSGWSRPPFLWLGVEGDRPITFRLAGMPEGQGIDLETIAGVHVDRIVVDGRPVRVYTAVLQERFAGRGTFELAWGD